MGLFANRQIFSKVVGPSENICCIFKERDLPGNFLVNFSYNGSLNIAAFAFSLNMDLGDKG